MGIISQWQLEIEDFFIDFIDSEVDERKVIELSCELGIIETYELSYESMGAEKIIFLYGSPEENFTIDEVFFMKFAKCVIRLQQTQNVDNSLFYIDLFTDYADDKDLIACALVKIFNKAFKGKNIFCFKYRKSIAFGCKCEFVDRRKNFALSKWYFSNQSDEILELITGANGDLNELLNLISEFSLLTSTIYDKQKYDFEYVVALQDIMSIYRVDLEQTIREYQNHIYQPEVVRSIYQIDLINIVENYHNSLYQKELKVRDKKDIIDILSDIGITELSSYDLLDKAERAKTSSEIKLSVEKTESVLIDVDIQEKIRRIPHEALNDASKMLKYL